MSVAEVARACEFNANVLHQWRREIQDYGAKAFTGNGLRRADEGRVAELERKVSRQALEIDFLRRCLQHVEEQRKLQALNTRSWSTRTPKGNEFGDAHSCGAAPPAGAGQPSRLLSMAHAPEAADRDLDLRDGIQRIALEFPYYCWPRITRELSDRGWPVNHRGQPNSNSSNGSCSQKAVRRLRTIANSCGVHARGVGASCEELPREAVGFGCSALPLAFSLKEMSHPARAPVRAFCELCPQSA